MNCRHVFACAFVLLAAAVPPAEADIIHMKDGSDLEGEIRKTAEGWIVVREGKITQVPAEQVGSIEVKPLVTAESSMSRLQSLRRAVDNLSDVRQIIERYQTFISQNRNTPAAAEAADELQAWRDRQSQGLVKMGDKWVTADERSAVRTRSTGAAVEIHDLLKANHYKEAAPLLEKALPADPENPSLLYLRGIMQFHQDQFAPARKSFEQVAAALADHPPTLNNLAVILWRQNAHGAALGYYDRAMIAAPGSQEVLDNVAEAINSMTPEIRKSPIAQKVIRRFGEQEEDLRKRMKQKGMYRWGSAWVDEQQKAKLEEQEKAVKDDLAKLQTDFDDTQARIAACDRRLMEIQQMMATLEAQSIGQTPDGKVIQLGLPQSYFQYSREMDGLRQTRASLNVSLDRLRSQAKQARLRMPAPRFSGIQKVIDADGMPLPLPPATRPAATQHG